MSGQITPSRSGSAPLRTHPPPPHAPAGPEGAWCTCGKPREACLSAEIRRLWSELADHEMAHSRPPS
ncbi:hypothetical protein GCM10010166_01150 [Couchioplanes caeruleus subsp. azureus]|nr:hypothetical protein GCM10010166_01150 [Couchioplanes caeruleus subsp. azureus]